MNISNGIQTYGVLLTLKYAEAVESLSIIQVSQNVIEHLGFTANELLNQPLSKCIPLVQLAPLKDFLKNPSQLINYNPFTWVLSVKGQTQRFNGIFYYNQQGMLLLCLEPVLAQANPDFWYIHQAQAIIARLQPIQRTETYYMNLVNEFQAFTGYDRVLLYSYNPLMGEQILAEANNSAYITHPHQYPYREIQPAIHLACHKHRLWFLNDIHQSISYLTPSQLMTGELVDMHMIPLNPQLPISLRHIQNNKVRAVFLLALIIDDKLWGFIVAQHNSPYRLPYAQRVACEVLGQAISTHLHYLQQTIDSRLYSSSDLTPATPNFMQALNECREHYHTVLNALEEGLIIHDHQGDIIEINQRACQILDMSLAEIKASYNTTQLRFFHEDGSPYPYQDYPPLYALHTDKPLQRLVLGVTHQDNENIKWLLINTQLLYRAGSHNPYALFASFTDISEHKRTEEALRKSEARLLKTQQLARLGYWELQLNSKLIEASRDFFQLFNLPYSTTPITVQTFLATIHPADRGYLQAYIERTIWQDEAYILEFRVFHHDNELHYLQTYLHPIYDKQGKIIAIQGATQDITLHKEAEERLKKAIDDAERAKSEAEQANYAKGAFLANMSHEIRTPINGVLGMVELLRSTPLNEQQHHYLERVHTSGETLLTVINDILDFSKIEAGKLALENIDFNFHELIADTAEFFNLSIQSKGLKFNKAFPPAFPTLLKGDPIRLRQILNNLLSNAIKFTETGEISLKITVLEDKERHILLHLEVIDTGIGISTDVGNRLFKPFSQADSTTTRKYGGTGLGLAITRRLLQMMNSEISLTSKVGQGSTVWFNLRFEKSTLITPARILPLPPIVLNTNVVQTPVTRVLLAEDNEINQEVASSFLAKLGCQTYVVENGKEALDFLAKNPIDIVFMDCYMPIMDGFTATEQRRAAEQSQQKPHLPIIALTANAMLGDKERCLSAGMDDYISKPFNMQHLRNALQRWLPNHFNGLNIPAPTPMTSPLTTTESLLNETVITNLRIDMQERGIGWLIDIYLNDAPHSLKHLKDAVAEVDIEKIKSYAHKFKGSNKTIGAQKAADYCFLLEKALKNLEDFAEVQRLFAELEQIVEATKQALIKEKNASQPTHKSPVN
ncbi:PAS domain S-box [Beggiatoa alba B18LD]|uniref:Sensory/regulatory protein RpfC n=1 Tax=Beggiatoa alba B18LD TaxID=395493 RepID=I3CD64_9GAMM|nr:ATP-binding protein [Beggiatoa alba]EIJ41557.1 PAS domain S-box [Beggiatoa alba B18LD]